MVITQTPFRMSFFGGGTDFPDFYEKHGGAVISTTFDKYCYVTVRRLPRFFEYKTHLTYSKTEYVNSTNEINHPAIREAMKYLDMHGLRLTYDSDLPAQSGLGTSSSFAVGMLNAFLALKGVYADKKRLADEAIYLERVLCDEAGGVQDQIAAAFGGLNRISFNIDGYTVQPIIISPQRKEQLRKNLMLFFTGFSRMSAQIQVGTKSNIDEKTNTLLEIAGIVDEAEKILVSNGDLNDFGRLLNYSWNLKKSVNTKISTDLIDIYYNKALEAGALGGKILGAGGGGFLLFYVESDKHESVRTALADLLYVPFMFENHGSRVIHFEPEISAPSTP